VNFHVIDANDKKTFSAVTAPMCVVSLGAVCCCPQLSEDCGFDTDNSGKTAIIKEEKGSKRRQRKQCHQAQ